jgi:O-antigen/teichoic acid export membrane protein
VPVLNSYDRVSYIQWANVVSAVCNFAIDYALVPRYGIIGAALATFVAYVVVALSLMYAVQQLFPVRFVMLLTISVGIIVFAASHFLLAISS